MTETKPWT